MPENIFQPYVERLKSAESRLSPEIRHLQKKVKEAVFEFLDDAAHQIERGMEKSQQVGSFQPEVSIRTSSLEVISRQHVEISRSALVEVLNAEEQIYDHHLESQLLCLAVTVAEIWIRAQMEIEKSMLLADRSMATLSQFILLYSKYRGVGNDAPNLN